MSVVELKAVPPADTEDINSLWLDSSLGDGLVDVRIHAVPVGKPKEFFRVHPHPDYRRLTEIYTHKTEGQIEEQHFLIDKPMHGAIEEARRATLVTVMYRDGSVRLWPLKIPKQSEKDNDAWVTARAAARAAMEKWLKLVWVRRSYLTREAQPGYPPDPDYSKLPPFEELIRLAFRDHGIIRSREHPVVKDLFGDAPTKSDDDDGLS